MKKILYILLLLQFIFFFTKESNALFLNAFENKSDNLPLFDNYNTSITYISVSAGFMLYGKDAFYFDKTRSLNYNTYLNISIGHMMDRSHFRHEIEFSMIRAYSKSFLPTPNSSATYNNVLYNFFDIDDSIIDSQRMLNAIGYGLSGYRIMYNIYYHFINPFEMNDYQIDFFIFSGIGVYWGKSFIYVDSEYQKTTDTTGKDTLSLVTYNNGSFDSAKSNTLKNLSAIGFTYDVGIGATVDIASIIAFQIKAKYGWLTRPIFDSSMSKISYGKGVPINMIDFAGLELGIILKAL